MKNQLHCGNHILDLDKPVVMGILNVKPDSYSDGGLFNRLDTALEHAHQLEKNGADIIDIGGESTSHGAEPVAEQAELDRLIPLIEKISSEIDLPESEDTIKDR